MKFLIAPDSFKGSLTAKEAALAMATGIRRVFPEAELELVPMADGGEGTVQSLVEATGGRLLKATVHNPLNQVVEADYGILGDGKTAIIEMAAASGLQYVDDHSKNPLVTTTYGTGELILAAVEQGVERIIIGLGGSATTDGGAGMVQAMGVRLLDRTGCEIGFGGGALADLYRIDLSQMDSRLRKLKIIVASDVTNPLTGDNGAARVFAPQKGATPAMVKILEQNLHHFAQVAKRDVGIDCEYTAGAGAAGGTGFGLLTFTGATVEKGIEIVLRYSHLAERVRHSDYVFTGEGSIDFQTKFGKTPYGVAKMAKKIVPTVPVIVLAGKIGRGVERLYEDGTIDAIFATPNGAKSLAQAIKDAAKDVSLTAENISRVIKRERDIK